MERKTALRKIDLLQNKHCDHCEYNHKVELQLKPCFNCPIGQEMQELGQHLTGYKEAVALLEKGEDITFSDIERMKKYGIENKAIYQAMGVSRMTYQEALRMYREAREMSV